MFYSHQLLSKKGPLGQIWIAATMQAKINRKKIDQIDISDVCVQILQPQVPLALRLSGILMRGVVLIYSRKVTCLYEDVSEFLVKIKTAMVLQPRDNSVLPRGKEHARFESVTINYGFSNVIEDIERQLLQPDTPPRDGQPTDDEYFIMPRLHLHQPVPAPSPTRQSFQATIEDITLEDNFSGLREHDELERNGQEEMIPPPDQNFDLFADIDMASPVDEPPSAAKAGQLETITEEPPPSGLAEANDSRWKSPESESGAVPPKSPEPDQARERARRPRNKKYAPYIILDEVTEIAALEFNSWLQDSADIIGRRQKPKQMLQDTSKSHKTLILPAALLESSSMGEPMSPWPEELLQFWQRSISEAPFKTGGLHQEDDNASQPTADKDSAAFRVNRPQLGAAVSDLNVNNVDSPGGEREDDFGSVERLRAAANTPSTGGRSQMDTPGHVDGSGLGKQRRSESGSGHLAMEDEPEQRTTGRSKRSKISHILQEKSPGIDNLNDDVYGPILDNLSPTGTPIGSKLRGLRGALSQYELMEETLPTQVHASLHDSIDNTTASLLQFLREQYDAPGESEELSLNELTEGLERWHAAKLFFQMCVLASNRYVGVKQKMPYGDISIMRGRYL